jgi:PAS domain S-box-containing protein
VFAAVGVAIVAWTGSTVSSRLDRAVGRGFPALLAAQELEQEWDGLAARTEAALTGADREELARRAGELDRFRARIPGLRAQSSALGDRLDRLEAELDRWDRVAGEAGKLRLAAAAAGRADPHAEARALDAADVGREVRSQLVGLVRRARTELTREMAGSRDALDTARRATILVAVLGALLVVIGALVNGRRILGPIRILSRTADDVARGNLEREIDLPGVDEEIAELAESFRGMTRGLRRSTVSKRHVDRILDSMRDCLVVCDSSARITQANPATTALLGWKAHELTGRPFRSLVGGDPRSRAVFEERFEELRSRGEVKGLELALRHKEDGEVPLMVSAAVLPGEGDGPAGFVFSGSDFRARKRVEEELRRAKSEAEEAARAKAEFLATMSHEIRTPMTAILGFGEILSEPGLPEEEREEAIGTIRANGRHLLELVNNILDFSKVEAGRLEVERIPVDTWGLLEETRRLMTAPARAKGLKLDLVGMNAVPETVHTDPTRLRQILINLIGNAIKFSSEGTILVVVHFAEEPDPEAGVEGTQLEVVVVDSGIGMSEQEVARVFEPFVQADGSMSRRHGGTGLGLTISKQLAVLLGGDIVATASPGQGAAFRVSVATGPVEGIRRVGREEGQQRWRERSRRTDTGIRLPSLAGARVLLVEDNAVNRRLVQRQLSKAGAEVETAEDGRAGLEKLRRARERGRPPAVLLTDLHLPGLDGHQLARAAREGGFRGAIVALTAGAVPDGMRDTFDACLSKPVERVRMIETLGGLAASVRREPGAGECSPVDILPCAGLRVLVAEDTPVNRRLLQHILERAGAETVLAANGAEALERVAEAEVAGKAIDAIVMDIRMPELDGAEATRRLRADGFGAPVIALTANSDAAERERCLEAGCDDFLGKPIDRRRLLRVLKERTRRAGAPAGG